LIEQTYFSISGFANQLKPVLGVSNALIIF
jgi:hypothetical protein